MPATKAQYDVFKSLYDEESNRYTALQDRAKTLLSIITLYGGIVLFKGDSIPGAIWKSRPATITLFVVGLAFTAALVAIVRAMQIRSYEIPFDALQYLEELPDNQPWTNASLFGDSVNGFAVATSRNADTNNSVAQVLTVANWLLVVGLAGTFALFFLFGSFKG